MLKETTAIHNSTRPMKIRSMSPPIPLVEPRVKKVKKKITARTDIGREYRLMDDHFLSRLILKERRSAPKAPPRNANTATIRWMAPCQETGVGGTSVGNAASNIAPIPQTPNKYMPHLNCRSLGLEIEPLPQMRR